MNFWDISKKGFLPVEDPRPFLTNKNLAAITPAYQLEILAYSLPQYQEQGVLIPAIQAKLGSIVDWEEVFSAEFLTTTMLGDLERLQLLLSLLNQVTFSNHRKTLPEVDMPLRAINHILGYRLYFYYLVNWARIYANSPVEFDEIKPLHLGLGKEFEATAIRFHVALEALAANSIKEIDQLATNASYRKEGIGLETTLRNLIETVSQMTALAEDREWAFHSSSLAKYAFGALIEPRARMSLCHFLTPTLPTEHSEFFRKLAKSGLRLDLLARKHGLMFLFEDLECQYRLFCLSYDQ